MAWDYTVMDLSNWKLTLPVDEDYFASDGGDGDTTDDEGFQVDGDDVEGFEADEIFFYDEDDEAMVFQADVAGATTGSSSYSRSELREVNDDGSNAAWTIDEGANLSASLKVTSVATRDDGAAGEVIVGQIHGENDELARLYYNSDGELYFSNEQTGTDDEERTFYFENADGEQPDVSLDEDFSYNINVADDELNIQIYADGETYSAVATDGVDPTEITDAWADDTFYFKAGVFNGVSDVAGKQEEGSGVAAASFYDIDLTGDGSDWFMA